MQRSGHCSFNWPTQEYVVLHEQKDRECEAESALK